MRRYIYKEELEDVFAVLDISLVRRELMGGRDTIVCSFAPRPGAKPRTRTGKAMHRMKGDVWIDEEEKELVRLEAEIIEDIKWAGGFLAKIDKGSRLSSEREKVNNEIWLPKSARIHFKARLLFKGLHLVVVPGSDRPVSGRRHLVGRPPAPGAARSDRWNLPRAALGFLVCSDRSGCIRVLSKTDDPAVAYGEDMGPIGLELLAGGFYAPRIMA